MPTAYGYIRVSTAKQASSELGLLAQRRMIRDYFASRLKPLRVTLGVVYADPAVSAFRRGLPDRPQGAKLMSKLQAGDHIIIAKMDRAFRSVIDFAATLLRWHRMGVHVHLLDLGVDTTTSGGRLVASIMASIAEWESRRIGERIKEALEERRSQGRATNGYPPIGYRQRKKRWLPCPRERAVARRIHSLSQSLGWREIVRQLNRAGSRNRKGLLWTRNAVTRWAASAAANFPRKGLHPNRRK